MHSFLGKSTGKGGLGLWMHNLKSIEFLNFKSQNYSGPAIKMGAGVQTFEAYYAANAKGLCIVGGICPTVGLAGGFSQGGGHSILSSTYGLGADQALEWEVITADGELVTASPIKNSDLYWALSGGGGGTYGVVLSLTAKAHPDREMGGASLAFSSADISQDTYWDMIDLWHAGLPAIVDAGAHTVNVISRETFILLGLTWPGHSAEEIVTLLQPFTTSLKKQNIVYSLNVTSFPSFIEHFNKFFGPLPFGPPFDNPSWLIGGRLIPRSVVQTSNTALTAALRNTSSSGKFSHTLLGINVSHALVGNSPPNAVLPAWRDAIMSLVVIGNWNFSAPREEMVERQNELTNSIIPQLEAVTPGSGAYLNEADFQQLNWQEDFYGSNYERLRKVKKKYDPDNLFYATTAVGSEAWTVASDGRLCRS
jgi:FAD/FMN-containing dehydrogenase